MEWHSLLSYHQRGGMQVINPYVENLVAMGYDRQDCNVASEMFTKRTFPCIIHGRQFDTEDEYNEAVADFINGM